MLCAGAAASVTRRVGQHVSHGRLRAKGSLLQIMGRGTSSQRLSNLPSVIIMRSVVLFPHSRAVS